MWVAEAGRLSGQLLEVAGIAVISIGIIVAFIRAVLSLIAGEATYKPLRERVGRAVLLGLELLVGADIIRTVTTTPELKQVFVLGLIVLVRTFLSFSLQMELEGKWPWQRGSQLGQTP